MTMIKLVCTLATLGLVLFLALVAYDGTGF
jgi:hypothetical protein